MPAAEPSAAAAPDAAPQPALPVARVAVDVPLAHLDRPFDYRVTPDQDADAVPGARVRVRFAGRLRDGFVLERSATSDAERALAPLHKVVSAEPVLTPGTAALVRAVADHYAGTFADVVRLAVPPRHAATEKAAGARRDAGAAAEAEDVAWPAPVADPLVAYPDGAAYEAALRTGRSPRALWQVTPSAAPEADWAAGFAAAARACVEGGRGAVLLAPDQRDVARLEAACVAALGRSRVVALVAESGPAARYRAFLAAAHGRAQVVVGNRAAAYAPVRDLGLVALWDDGDDLWAEPRSPYPHTREVLALRAGQTGAAALFASYARTAELQAYVERGWLRPIAQERAVVRHAAPRVRVSGDDDRALARDPAARVARVPHEVFTLVRAALPTGPVLVQVPRSGGRLALVCQDCREPVRCTFCSGPTALEAGADRTMTCRWCGRPQVDWECPVCGGHHVRSPVVGATRTAAELGRSFPGVPVLQSSGEGRLDGVPGHGAVVVATPGAEPPAEGGYAAAILLDTPLLLLRPDLRAPEEALRRWLAVVALVRGGADGGSVLAVGDSSGRALQALVRVDPAGFAARELADRAEAHFPPAAKVVTVDGAAAVLTEYTALVHEPPGTETLGPVPLPPREQLPGGDGEPLLRLTLRAPVREGAALVHAAKEVSGVRSARKSDGAVRVRVDPVVLG
ncbi:primosomal protein N' [Microlunatus flavus]|uniref:Probable replication restart protein PriA n=1 Tax=Microlunatus flavus TaxID=1036181 RepID=A0A1H9FI69_9ACTN|nr:primosomal protein N' [Microlunatus flavus]SEQ37619.1 replication restart DNA helicase PriA [Microlunatus flavus]